MASNFNQIPSKASEISFNKLTSESKPSPTSHCSFLVELADIQSMKQDLLGLLNTFRAGKLRAFGGREAIEQMEDIRNMQGRLARQHFGLDSQVSYEGLEESADGLALQRHNMATLLQNLDHLGGAIKSLSSPTTGSSQLKSDTKFF